MKIVAVVPIKLNNVRLPNKNIMSFDNGKPLCWYVLKTLLSIKDIHSVYVYCSNESILQYIPPGVKFLKRSSKLDSNDTKMNEILYEFANEISADAYLLAHTTAPFLTAESILKGINALKTGEYDSAFTAKKLQDFIWKDNKPMNYSLDSIPRTQDLEVIYCETSGYYLYKSDIILKLKRRIGNYPYIVEIGEIESIDIDEKEDFDIANAIYNFLLVRKDNVDEEY